MKKTIAFLLAVSLILGLTTTSSFAQRKKRTVRKNAVKKVVKKKAAKQAVKKAVKPEPKTMAPVVPIIEAPVIITTSEAVPPAVIIPQPEVKLPAPAPAAAKGFGLTTGFKAGMTAGVLALTADMDYSLAKIVANTKVRISADFITGKEVTGSNTFRIFDAKIGAIYDLPMLKLKDVPLDFYVGSAFILPVVYSSARTGSKWGAEAFLGATYNAPEIGTIYGELGYAGLKYDGSQPAQKGISAGIGLSSSF